MRKDNEKGKLGDNWTHCTLGRWVCQTINLLVREGGEASRVPHTRCLPARGRRACGDFDFYFSKFLLPFSSFYFQFSNPAVEGPPPATVLM